MTAWPCALSVLRASQLPPKLTPNPDEGPLEAWPNQSNRMRILHLSSDYRWTGPADPVLNLVQALRGRGIDATLACRNAPTEVAISLPQKAAERGFPVELRFHLDRYCGLFHTISDLWHLPRYLRRERINIVHTHLSHDHVMGALCARLAHCGILVVRTNHKGEPAANSRIDTGFLRCCTDAYVGFSRRVVEEDRMRLGLPAERVCTVHPALDLARFDPSKRYKDVRGELGIPSAAVVGGIVARVQRHRRFEILIEAIKRASEVVPELRFPIIGRGERLQRNVMEPVAALGLERVVLLPGYRSDDYVDYLNALDFKVSLVPGSDGTCRAAREAMAMGKPVIAARRGILDELVPDGQAGLVIEDTPENLAAAIIEITRNTELRNRLGQGARAHAQRHFRLEDQAAAIASLYERLNSNNNTKPPSA
jgi:glycosyltransferase involved in cell wall biosynthesis